MNYDTIFFCKYCRKSRPVEGRVQTRTKPTLFRCACCETSKQERHNKTAKASS